MLYNKKFPKIIASAYIHSVVCFRTCRSCPSLQFKTAFSHRYPYINFLLFSLNCSFVQKRWFKASGFLKMLPSVLFCLVLCSTAIAANGANILVFMPMPSKSHFHGFRPLFEELSRRGHNLTVASSFPLDRPMANYTDVGPFITREKGPWTA